MADAKMHNGRAIVAYVDGKAVDSEGKVIEGAPKPPKDTPREKQPGSTMATPEERMGHAIAQAIINPQAVVARQVAAERDAGRADTTGETSTDEEEGLPTVADLPDHLAGITSAAEVRRLQANDERTTAQKHYDARLAELEGT